MRKKYYLDTSIWIDLYEDRKGYNNEPLGDFAFNLFLLIKARKGKIIISDVLIRELEVNYSMEQIRGLVKPFENIIEKIIVTKKQKDKAKKIAKEKNMPLGDVLHAIIAKDNKLILVTRDKHFRKLKEIWCSFKPEELI